MMLLVIARKNPIRELSRLKIQEKFGRRSRSSASKAFTPKVLRFGTPLSLTESV